MIKEITWIKGGYQIDEFGNCYRNGRKLTEKVKLLWKKSRQLINRFDH